MYVLYEAISNLVDYSNDCKEDAVDLYGKAHLERANKLKKLLKINLDRSNPEHD